MNISFNIKTVVFMDKKHSIKIKNILENYCLEWNMPDNWPDNSISQNRPRYFPTADSKTDSEFLIQQPQVLLFGCTLYKVPKEWKEKIVPHTKPVQMPANCSFVSIRFPHAF